MADSGPDIPEEEPEAALEALAEGELPASPARRRRIARGALLAVRNARRSATGARRSARIGMGLGVLALLVAIGVGILALTREPQVAGTEAAAATEDIVAGARPGTVFIRASGLGQDSVGTGVVVDAEDHLVLTNFHVIALGGELQVGEPDRLEDADVVAAAPCEDLALLEVEDLRGSEEIPLGEQAQLKQGDTVVALGFPASASGGKSLTSTAGIVSSVRTRLNLPAPDQPRFPNLVQTDAALGPGNSGGPLVGDDGRLVGVNTILFTGGPGSAAGDQGYAIGVDRVRRVLGDLRAGRSRGWFGAGLLTPPPAILREQQLPSGMLVTVATDGTSAAEAGLEEVLITAVGDRPVRSSLASYCRAVEGVESGEQRDVTVVTGRGRERQTLAINFE